MPNTQKLLRLPAVMGVVGLRRSAIYARCADGRMPPPCHLGRAALWPADEIEDWISRVRERGEPPVGTYAPRQLLQGAERHNG